MGLILPRVLNICLLQLYLRSGKLDLSQPNHQHPRINKKPPTTQITPQSPIKPHPHRKLEGTISSRNEKTRGRVLQSALPCGGGDCY